jgi:hypothetical protein
MKKPTILYINHKEKIRCGVYQFGYHIGQVLQKSEKYNFLYVECNTEAEFQQILRKENPAMIIYNYHDQTLPWVTHKLTERIKVPQIGTIHEITQEKADIVDVDLFDAYIAPDPTLVLTNPLVFKTGRLVLPYKNTFSIDKNKTVIGSFGFGLEGKGFDKLILKVQEEFDEAIIRLHIPFSDFADANGDKAKQTAIYCQNLLTKKGISLEISHDFLTTTALQEFLAKNTLNAFFYEEYKDRGLSSVVDFALAVGRPIALSKSLMFRHLGECDIFVEDKTLKEIIQQGTKPIERYTKIWCQENLLWDYEEIVSQNIDKPSKVYLPFDVFSRLRRYAKYKINKIKGKKIQKIKRNQSDSAWLYHKSKSIEYFPIKQKVHYTPVEMDNEYNTILDNRKRQQYADTIRLISDLNPEIIKLKIPEANIQQAFVFDTVFRLAQNFTNPRILCVGSFEDTACLSLRKVGFDLEENDPVLNYPLEKFITRPVRNHHEYDIIFSTSVIEHVEEDEVFVHNMSKLLANNGFIVLTCDFEKDYKKGDAIPDVDWRFYTQQDFTERLLPATQGCEFYGKCNWDYEAPDFFYLNTYRYTFGTVVFHKK